MLMNLHTLDWDDELLDFFGVDRRCLAKIVSNSQVYGHVKGGVLNGIPIAGMIGDQQAALVGNKCFEKGEAKNTYGALSDYFFLRLSLT
jgi:glycerol kinase